MLLMACCQPAAASEFGGTVLRVVCHVQDVASICQVAVNGVAPTVDCVTSSWRYSFAANTPEGKNVLAILLTAQASHLSIVIGGKGSCALSGGSEDLRHVYIVTP